MSARIGPFKSHHGWVCTPAVLLMLVLLPASASAAPPTCAGGQFSVLHDRTLVFGRTVHGRERHPHAVGRDIADQRTARLHNRRRAPQYTPNAGYVGADSFTYKATDQTPEESDTATVTITVTDQAPTCNDTSTTTTVGKPVDISNLFDCDDADSDPITIYFDDGEHGVTDDNGTHAHARSGVRRDRPSPLSRLRRRTGVTNPCDNRQGDRAARAATSARPGDTEGHESARRVDVEEHESARVLPHASEAEAGRCPRSQGIKLVETSNEPGTLKVTITVDKNTARKLKIKPNAKRPVTIGTLTRTVGVGETERHRQADPRRAQSGRARSQGDMPRNCKVGRCRRKCHDAHREADTEAVERVSTQSRSASPSQTPTQARIGNGSATGPCYLEATSPTCAPVPHPWTWGLDERAHPREAVVAQSRRVA